MQFLNPAAFYLLGLLPIVVALHFLKLHRHTRLVPSIMLWHTTDEDRRANVPFQRLRNLLLPLLQVLFLLLVTFSVARPAVRSPASIPGKAILIVDNSASMLSEETGQTRLALAKQAARKQIEQVSAKGGTMLMVTHAPETYIQQAFTTDAAKLNRAIKNIASTHAPRNLRPVFDAATRYAESPQTQLIFISDSFENLPDISLPVHKIRVGDDAENVGIVQFSVETTADRYEVLAGIQNFTETRREFDVQLTVENVLLDEKTAAIPPGKIKSVLFSGAPSGLEGRVIRVQLAVEDDFPLDNTASALLSAVSPLRMLLVSDTHKFLLLELLQAYGSHVELRRVAPADYHGAGDANLVIFDGSTAIESLRSAAVHGVPTTHFIFINPGSYLPFMSKDVPDAETDTGPALVIKTDESHPLMAGVSLQGLSVRVSTHRALPLWGHSLVETEKGSLIWVGRQAGSQLLVFEFDAFNPEISTFGLTGPDEPLFMYQCFAWFEAGTAPLQPLLYQESRTRHVFRTGEQVRIATIGEDTPFHVQKPDKTWVELDNLIFTQTEQVGVYTLFADERVLERFTVNLLNAGESALSHSATTPAAQTETAVRTGLQPIAREVWHFPVLLAFVVLLLEWWFYHREGL